MKLRSMPIAAALAILAAAFLWYRINSTNPRSSATPPAGSKLSHEQFQAAWKHDRDYNYRAVANNGSKRGGLRPDQVSPEARRIAKEYKNVIYPAVTQYLVKYKVLHGGTKYLGLPANLTQNGGSKWSIGYGHRLDGTMIARDVYSKSPSDAPHDPWAANFKFLNVAGHWGRGFTIHGWDDGRVTFDPVDYNYFGVSQASTGTIPMSAPPGAAGIPATAVQGVKQWLASNP